MAHAEFIGLDQIKLFPRWTDAPNGILLQLKDQPAEPTVVFRCQAHNVRGPLVLVLEGQRRGLLLSLQHLADGPAIDVSDLLDLTAKDVAPIPRKGGPFEVGKLYELLGAIIMLAEVPNSNGLRCFILLTGENRGTSHPADLHLNVIELGFASTRVKDEP